MSISQRRWPLNDWNGRVTKRKLYLEKIKQKYSSLIVIYNTLYKGLLQDEIYAIKLFLYLEQDKKCAICHIEIKYFNDGHLDHCHGTGFIRGLLCRSCNHGLGCFKDSNTLLINAIKYVSTKYIIEEEIKY